MGARDGVHAWKPRTWRLREEDHCQFKTSVGYIMSSKLVLATV